MQIWKQSKVKVKILLRFIEDLIRGNFFRFSKKCTANLPHSICLTQEIKQSETYENKVFNLALASNQINKYLVMPNEILSFWNIIGNPNQKYKKGRAIINGKLTVEIGGGLCQVSGILHQIALLAGLKIIERHNHSIDIYTNETRFAPLGTDATVVYGYKDLRFINNYDFPIKFQLDVVNNSLNVKLMSLEKIEERKLIYEVKEDGDFVKAFVRSEANNILSVSKYQKNQSLDRKPI